ncbi:MAG: CP12 domain-containing protein [Cyanobacteria bacterium J06614_10]
MTTTTTPETAMPAALEPSAIPVESTYGNRLSAALEHARRLTQMHGYQNVDVALAWETVEELQAAHLRRLVQAISCQSMFERYCSEYPHALECRSYDC